MLPGVINTTQTQQGEKKLYSKLGLKDASIQLKTHEGLKKNLK